MELEKLRLELDKIDFRMVSLLEKRKKKVIQIGKVKKLIGMAIIQKEREKETVQKLINQSDIEPEVIENIYRVLFNYSYQLQKKKK